MGSEAVKRFHVAVKLPGDGIRNKSKARAILLQDNQVSRDFLASIEASLLRFAPHNSLTDFTHLCNSCWESSWN